MGCGGLRFSVCKPSPQASLHGARQQISNWQRFEIGPLQSCGGAREWLAGCEYFGRARHSGRRRQCSDRQVRRGYPQSWRLCRARPQVVAGKVIQKCSLGLARRRHNHQAAACFRGVLDDVSSARWQRPHRPFRSHLPSLDAPRRNSWRSSRRHIG